jgi:hypothetical protein
VWRHISVSPALGRLRQENQEIEASLGYIVSHYLKKRMEGRDNSSAYETQP